MAGKVMLDELKEETRLLNEVLQDVFHVGLTGSDVLMETDADVLRICEGSLRLRNPGGHGTQLKRVYELAGRPVPEQVLRRLNCFYFYATADDAIHFGQVVREARQRVEEQATPPGWMAL